MDYEDQLQRQGFRFRIQVNDKGEDNDNDKYHVAYSWVVVKLRDINDNKPVFEKSNIEAFVSENARVGKTLERFRASDPDQGGHSKVRYFIDRSSDRRRQFAISEDGTVSIQRELDRETTPSHQIKILAVDEPDADDYFEDCKDEERSDEQDSGKQDSEMQVEDQMIQSTDWHWEMPVEERWNQLDLLEAKFWKLVLKQIYCYSSH